MTYGDFYRAVTPYNHSHICSNEKYIETHKEKVSYIMNYSDADNDGTISFTEFFFFMTVVQMPHVVIHDWFEEKGGKMDAAEFSKSLT
jgi:Ca2+-binding EF-hand superfamily protein